MPVCRESPQKALTTEYTEGHRVLRDFTELKFAFCARNED